MASNGRASSSLARGTKNYQMEKILIEYDGEYPCLCMGKLKVTINGAIYNFPDHCLTSGGCAYFTDDYSNECIEEGPWEVNEWPDDFPEEYKKTILSKINNTIPYGCCGGCL